MTGTVPRRQVLRACAAATLLAAVREPALGGEQAAAARVFFFDPRHASSQRYAALLQRHWGSALALSHDEPRTLRALPASTQLMAGRTTYADFTWLAALASERRLRTCFHAYHTLAAAGTVERRVLVEEGVRASRLQRLTPAECDRWLQERLPGCPELPWGGVSRDADRAGCTLHDWIFQAV